MKIINATCICGTNIVINLDRSSEVECPKCEKEFTVEFTMSHGYRLAEKTTK